MRAGLCRCRRHERHDGAAINRESFLEHVLNRLLSHCIDPRGARQNLFWIAAEFMDALLPLASLPTQISGRNRMWRKIVIDGIRQDPEWNHGDYSSEPRAALEIATDFLLIAGSTPLPMQISYPTRDAADKDLEDYRNRVTHTLDANDLLYAVSASRNYDPSSQLEKITAPVMYINSADDFINPPELGIAEREIKGVKHGKFVLIPASEQTHGHGTHTWAPIWQEYLKELLEETKK